MVVRDIKTKKEMKENLVIVESPAKAKTIEKFLGSDYKVMSSYGHIRDLKKKTFSIDENTFEPQYEIPADKEKLVGELRKKKFGRGPQWAGSGICYNPLCPTRNNYRGAWSCTECRFCPERKFARQSRREVLTI